MQELLFKRLRPQYQERDDVAAKHAALLESEIAELKAESARLAAEIEELTGEPVTGMV